MFYLKSVMSVVFVVSLLISFKVSAPEEAQMTLVDASYFKANEPMGVANGIFPGRVVWIHNPDATNANMANTTSDYWALDKNCNQQLVDSMLASGIRRIGGKANIREAWDEIFKYYNEKHGKGAVGYTPGEKFAVKINLTNSNGAPGPTRMDSSPQLVLAMLHQLIEVVGVPQKDIWMGDNYRTFRDNYWAKCHTVYPDVHYIDGTGYNGREKTKPSAEQLIRFSDGLETSSIPQHYLDATYFINMPCLKSHDTAGITLAAKNHQGTILHEGEVPQNQSAMYMHYAFPQNNSNVDQYRHLVDYMGHEELGGKTLIYIVDGLWAGRSWEGFLEKWKMAPFNNDYPSSLFLSQDAVAIESVGFDFLLAEYAAKASNQKYPYMSGVDDYMKQAADPANWPAGIEYDPEGDGTLLTSLGVYEHWNNATDKKYSRNLGAGAGIELMYYKSESSDPYLSELTETKSPKAQIFKIYPNPFVESLHVQAFDTQKLIFNVVDMNGRLVFRTEINGNYLWNGRLQDGLPLPTGFYLVRLIDKTSGRLVWTEKIIRR